MANSSQDRTQKHAERNRSSRSHREELQKDGNDIRIKCSFVPKSRFREIRDGTRGSRNNNIIIKNI